MDSTAKETVIIVHGTWAAPQAGKNRWYQPSAGVAVAEPFIAKLNAALEERGSPARCWAHCGPGEQIFQWSGENSWIARTRAASALGAYVAKLRNEGWHCHIIAHSHGGNIVAEAYPQLSAYYTHNIVTLGTPFMDTASPVKDKTAGISESEITAVFVFISMALAWGLFLLSLIIMKAPNLLIELLFLILSCILLLSIGRLCWLIIHRRSPASAPGAGRPGFAELAAEITTGTSRILAMRPRLLAINSPMDEAWQIMRHIRTIKDPLRPEANLCVYVFSSLRSQISQRTELSAIHGAKSLRDVGFPGKLAILSVHIAVISILCLLSMAFYSGDSLGLDLALIGIAPVSVLALLVIYYTGPVFYSAFFSPYRRCAWIVSSLWSIPRVLATYIVLCKGWSVLLAVTMGLEGYRYRVPMVEQHPSDLTPAGKYEDMPKGAVERALAKRNAWMSGHFDDVARTLSKMVVTAADLEALLLEVEADQSLVHAAYYTDDECIARIADWIAAEDELDRLLKSDPP